MVLQMLEIKAHWSKTADVDVRRRLQQPMAIAVALAHHIRHRMSQGQTVTPPQSYAGKPTAGPRKRPAYYLSPKYAEELGLGEQTRWESSQAMHRAKGLKESHASATGKMWAGLSVRNYGGEAALIEFGGSSLGASSVRSANLKTKTGTYEVTVSGDGKMRAKQAREFSRDEDGKVKYRRKPKLVRNSIKAAAVFSNTRIGILQNTDAELAAMGAAVAHMSGLVVAQSLGGDTLDVPIQGDKTLYDAILKEYRK